MIPLYLTFNKNFHESSYNTITTDLLQKQQWIPLTSI